jgi:hypothetical protein
MSGIIWWILNCKITSAVNTSFLIKFSMFTLCHPNHIIIFISFLKIQNWKIPKVKQPWRICLAHYPNYKKIKIKKNIFISTLKINIYCNFWWHPLILIMFSICYKIYRQINTYKLFLVTWQVPTSSLRGNDVIFLP